MQLMASHAYPFFLGREGILRGQTWYAVDVDPGLFVLMFSTPRLGSLFCVSGSTVYLFYPIFSSSSFMLYIIKYLSSPPRFSYVSLLDCFFYSNSIIRLFYPIFSFGSVMYLFWLYNNIIRNQTPCFQDSHMWNYTPSVLYPFKSPTRTSPGGYNNG